MLEGFKFVTDTDTTHELLTDCQELGKKCEVLKAELDGLKALADSYKEAEALLLSLGDKLGFQDALRMRTMLCKIMRMRVPMKMLWNARLEMAYVSYGNFILSMPKNTQLRDLPELNECLICFEETKVIICPRCPATICLDCYRKLIENNRKIECSFCKLLISPKVMAGEVRKLKTFFGA